MHGLDAPCYGLDKHAMDWMSHAMDWMSHAMDWMGRSSPALYALSSESPLIRAASASESSRLGCGPGRCRPSVTRRPPRFRESLRCWAVRRTPCAPKKPRMSGLGCQDPDVGTRMSGPGCRDSDVRTRPRPSGDTDTAPYRASYLSSMLRVF